MKILLYLDQPFLSNICKSRRNHPGLDPVWSRLDQAIHHAVSKTETILCPASPFQDEEASLDSRLVADIHSIAASYSAGVSFLYWSTILDTHARRALYRFCGQSLLQEDWSHTFDADPHELLQAKYIESPGGDFFIDAHVPRPVEFIEEHRELKRVLVEQLETRPRPNEVSYQEVLKKQKKLFVTTRFLLPAARVAEAMAEGRVPSLVDIQNADSGKSLLREFRTLTGAGEHFQDFLFSDEMFAAPFVDVFSSLYATLDFHATERRPRGSDFDDIPILATVVPYCQLVTMDSGMKDICYKAGLHERYSFESYCPKTSDIERLIERVSTLVIR